MYIRDYNTNYRRNTKLPNTYSQFVFCIYSTVKCFTHLNFKYDMTILVHCMKLWLLPRLEYAAVFSSSFRQNLKYKKIALNEDLVLSNQYFIHNHFPIRSY